VGNVQRTAVAYNDSLFTVGRRYNIGGYEMMEANPGVDYSNPRAGHALIVPSRYVLPEGPQQGIVINLAELRLYYYHPDKVHVSTYPIGVGQNGWDTPLGSTQVVRKREKPTWVVPDSILKNHEELGQPIEKVRGPGPNNPLGDYAMNLGFKNIVLHGTNTPRGVGVRSSHGCIRMLPEDIAVLFHQVKVGTPVRIIHEPVKIGRLDNQLFLEAHVPISQTGEYVPKTQVNTRIESLAQQAGSRFDVRWDLVQRFQHKASGIPSVIGTILE